MLKYTAAASADASMEAFSSQSTAASGSGTMKIRNAKGKAVGSHPFRAEEQKPTGRDETHKRESHQGQSIVDTQAPTPLDLLQPVPRFQVLPQLPLRESMSAIRARVDLFGGKANRL